MRLLFILLMIVGAIFFGAIALNNFYALYLIKDRPEVLALRFFPGAFWGGLALLASGACAGGMFMRPGELKEMTDPEPPMMAPWLKEMQEGSIRLPDPSEQPQHQRRDDDQHE